MRKEYQIPEYEIEKFNVQPVLTAVSDGTIEDGKDIVDGNEDGFDF